MARTAADTAAETPAVRVTRARRSALWGLIGAVVVVILLATLPYVVYADVTDLLVNAFILLVLASMWNLLAGYCGLISVGQQAYIGVGAYTVLLLAQSGINPYLAIPFAVVVAAAIAVPVSFLVFRLRAEYFAIGTWVVAEVFFLVLVRIRSAAAPGPVSQGSR
jgi:branched-chain amino acid transport system permease protein